MAAAIRASTISARSPSDVRRGWSGVAVADRPHRAGSVRPAVRSIGGRRANQDQTLVSGIGNIYADEALWAAKVHGETATSSLTKPRISAVIDAAREVMAAALAQGGTSFDSLYVDVAGSSGYFSRSLNVYGLAGQPCPRCGTPLCGRSL